LNYRRSAASASFTEFSLCESLQDQLAWFRCGANAPAERWPQVLSNWKAAGGLPLAAYAPYTAHCLLVDTFFHVTIGKKLISPDRLSKPRRYRVSLLPAVRHGVRVERQAAQAGRAASPSSGSGIH
jgi:hypothetical protein